MRKEERKFLLKKLCQYEPQTEAQVQAAARGSSGSTVPPVESKKLKRRLNREVGMFIFFILHNWNNLN